MSNIIDINGRKIGLNYSSYVIVEMSANHNSEIDNAYKIIDMANTCGADAVKLQTYHPDTITMNMSAPEFMIKGGTVGWSKFVQAAQGIMVQNRVS